MPGLVLLVLPALLQAGCPGTPLRAAAERWAACAGIGAARDLLEAVAKALRSNGWRDELTDMAARQVPGAVDCAVKEVVNSLLAAPALDAGARVQTLLPAEADRKRALANGLQWIKEHHDP